MQYCPTLFVDEATLFFFAASLLRPTARLHVDSMFDLSSLYRQLWAEIAMSRAHELA